MHSFDDLFMTICLKSKFKRENMALISHLFSLLRVKNIDMIVEPSFIWNTGLDKTEE